MSTSQAQHFINRHGRCENLLERVGRHPGVERDDCPLGSRVSYFFPDGSILVANYDASIEVVEGRHLPGV